MPNSYDQIAHNHWYGEASPSELIEQGLIADAMGLAELDEALGAVFALITEVAPRLDGRIVVEGLARVVNEARDNSKLHSGTGLPTRLEDLRRFNSAASVIAVGLGIDPSIPISRRIRDIEKDADHMIVDDVAVVNLVPQKSDRSPRSGSNGSDVLSAQSFRSGVIDAGNDAVGVDIPSTTGPEALSGLATGATDAVSGASTDDSIGNSGVEAVGVAGFASTVTPQAGENDRTDPLESLSRARVFSKDTIKLVMHLDDDHEAVDALVGMLELPCQKRENRGDGKSRTSRDKVLQIIGYAVGGEEYVAALFDSSDEVQEGIIAHILLDLAVKLDPKHIHDVSQADILDLMRMYWVDLKPISEILAADTRHRMSTTLRPLFRSIIIDYVEENSERLRQIILIHETNPDFIALINVYNGLLQETDDGVPERLDDTIEPDDLTIVQESEVDGTSEEPHEEEPTLFVEDSELEPDLAVVHDELLADSIDADVLESNDQDVLEVGEPTNENGMDPDGGGVVVMYERNAGVLHVPAHGDGNVVVFGMVEPPATTDHEAVSSFVSSDGRSDEEATYGIVATWIGDVPIGNAASDDDDGSVAIDGIAEAIVDGMDDNNEVDEAAQEDGASELPVDEDSEDAIDGIDETELGDEIDTETPTADSAADNITGVDDASALNAESTLLEQKLADEGLRYSENYINASDVLSGAMGLSSAERANLRAVVSPNSDDVDDFAIHQKRLRPLMQMLHTRDNMRPILEMARSRRLDWYLYAFAGYEYPNGSDDVLVETLPVPISELLAEGIELGFNPILPEDIRDKDARGLVTALLDILAFAERLRHKRSI